jgi:hypothetical protein
MPSRRPPPIQPSLLDWQPSASYAPDTVRAATLGGRISRAVAQTLRDCPRERGEIAARMGAFLGEPVSPAMLNAYASQAREDHNISAVRLAALAHATDDPRLLDMLAEALGLAVIPRGMLPLLELAGVHEEMDALRRRRDALRSLAARGGR